jgi:hypothetical protein
MLLAPAAEARPQGSFLSEENLAGSGGADVVNLAGSGVNLAGSGENLAGSGGDEPLTPTAISGVFLLGETGNRGGAGEMGISSVTGGGGAG